MNVQPPSGGCVLKLYELKTLGFAEAPAAFRRLCVETNEKSHFEQFKIQPPSGGCVLKPAAQCGHEQAYLQPPSGGCVLKPD